MYRVVFVENVLFHGQNGKKSKSASFWAIREAVEVENLDFVLELERLVGEKKPK